MSLASWLVLALAMTFHTQTEAVPVGIQRLHERDIRATKSFDVDALSSLWTDDIVSMAPGSSPVVGKDANLTLLRLAKAASSGMVAIGYVQEWREVKVYGSEAVEWGVFTSTFQAAQGAPPTTQRHNVMRVLRLEAGEWKVARTIFSPSR